MTVLYSAAASMANQLTLLNIVRAEHHLPIFYTSISRLSGSAQVTTSGGFNAALKSASPTDTVSPTNSTVTTVNGATTSTTTVPPATTPTSVVNGAAATNVATTVTNATSRAVTTGGNLYTPSIGGQIVSGPGFDINILDTQQFYQGVLQEVPFSTVETFINQGIDDGFLMRLLIERIEFRLQKDLDPKHPAGSLYRVIYNPATDRKIPIPDAADYDPTVDESKRNPDDASDYLTPSTAFVQFVACHRLRGETQSKPPKPLAPVSRLDGDKYDLAVQDKSGKNSWNIKGYIDGPEPDENVFVVRLATDKRVPALPSHECASLPGKLREVSGQGRGQVSEVYKLRIFPLLNQELLGVPSIRASGSATFGKNGGPKIDTDVFVFFRSPEGLIRFLGQYLEASKPTATPELVNAFLDSSNHTSPLFSLVERSSHGAIVSTSLNGTTFSIEDDANKAENMQVIALVEELIDLQKSSTDRPGTVPVHVLP